MKWFVRVLSSLTAGFVLTIAMAVVSVIYVMFSSGSEPGRHLAFFGSVFFEVRDGSGGALDIGIGLASPIPLIVAFLVVSALILAVIVSVDSLKIYKKRLINDQQSH